MLLWALAAVATARASLSGPNYVPLGSNPTLYQPGFEPIWHLDQATFTDTVLNQDLAFVVEFYADWCGHCRAFAPFYRDFASKTKEWGSVVTVAAMNCADSFNAQACRDNGITHYPMLKSGRLAPELFAPPDRAPTPSEAHAPFPPPARITARAKSGRPVADTPPSGTTLPPAAPSGTRRSSLVL